MNAPAVKRRSRFGSDPLLDDKGRARVAVLSENDNAILAFLARRRYATAEEIALITGGSVRWTRDKLDHLKSKPNLYVRVCEEQTSNPRAHQWNKLIYELNGPGVTYLRGREMDIPPRHRPYSFPHEIMVSQIMTSFDLAAVENPNIRIVDWAERLAHPKTPEATRQMTAPAQIPLGAVVGRADRQHIRADGDPFGIERAIDGKNSYFWFPGIEADRGTEPVKSYDFKRSSIHGKLQEYLHVIRNNIHFTHFGYNKMFVPIITVSKPRMQSMMECLASIDPKGSQYFLFKTFTPFDYVQPQQTPSGFMATEDWLRVGHPPLNLTA